MGNKKYVAYVGTYTHGNSKGIQVYDVDVENGKLIERSEVKVSNASHTAVSKNGKFLYSIEDEGVAVFQRDKHGDLTRINSVGIDGMRGCFLATDVDGRYLYVAGYHDGKVTVVHTHKDGSLGRIMDGVFHKGLGSVAERNFRPHVNCVRPTPDNKYLCAVDNGIDQIKIYRINKRRHKLELVDILRCPRESGPRIIRFSSDGKYAYILFELSNEIKVYSYDGSGENPEFELLQSVSTLSKKHDKDAIHNAASGLALAPDGKHLFKIRFLSIKGITDGQLSSFQDNAVLFIDGLTLHFRPQTPIACAQPFPGNTFPGYPKIHQQSKAQLYHLLDIQRSHKQKGRQLLFL